MHNSLLNIRNFSHDNFKKLPGSLSLQRGTVVSDGAFNLFEDGKQEPLHVMYHGIRGTQNVAGNKEKVLQQATLLLVKSLIFSLPNLRNYNLKLNFW